MISSCKTHWTVLSLVLIAHELQSAQSQSTSLESAINCQSTSSSSTRQASSLTPETITKMNAETLQQNVLSAVREGKLDIVKLLTVECNHRSLRLHEMADNEHRGLLFHAIRQTHEADIIPMAKFLWTQFVKELKHIYPRNEEHHRVSIHNTLQDLRENARINESPIKDFSCLQKIQFKYATSESRIFALAIPTGTLALALTGWCLGKMIRGEDPVAREMRDNEDVGFLGIAVVAAFCAAGIHYELDELNLVNFNNQPSAVKTLIMLTLVGTPFALGLCSGLSA